MIEKDVQLVITNNQVLLLHVETIDRMSITPTILIIYANLEFYHANAVLTVANRNVLRELTKMLLALVESENVMMDILIHLRIHKHR